MQDLEREVVAFITEQRGVGPEKLKLQTTLLGDLGIDGDDGIELLERFARKFSVDLSGCDPCRYFGPEGLAPWTPIYWLYLALRSGMPEQRASLQPIIVADMIRSAQTGFWEVRNHK